MNGAVLVGVAAAGCPLLGAASFAARDRGTIRSAVMGRFGPDDAGASDARRSRVRRLGGPALAAAAGAGGLILGGPAVAVAGVVAAAVGPSIRSRRRRAAERAALEDGLAEAVSAIAAAIRAGRSMAGAIEEAASTVASPLGPRLAGLVDRVALGVSIDRALLDLARSVPGPDARLVVAVLGLHQRTGGNVPVVLDRVAGTLRERRASAREVRSLTAQARLSGLILGFLPIGFFLFLSVTARADVARALGSTTGLTAIVVGLVMQGTAFVWIKRLLRVDA